MTATIKNRAAMDYFAFFDLPPRLVIDEDALRKAYYANSKKYHPDFYTLESEEKQAEILELSTLNNQAYQTLADFDRRLRYVLELEGALADEGQNQLPQTFLTDMMDINEALMELEFDPDPETHAKTQQRIEALEVQLLQEYWPVVQQYTYPCADPAQLAMLKDFYLKKRYLLRIRENFSKFAPL